jgi:hypothetical protein
MLLVLLTRILLWVLIGWLIWYILVQYIPKPYLTWLGGFVLLALLVFAFIEPDNRDAAIVWQILSLPLRPLGLVLLLLIAAFRDGWKKVKIVEVRWALGILFVTSLPIVAAFLMGNLERSIFRAAAVRQELCAEICPAVLVPASGTISAIVVFSDRVDQIDRWVEPFSQISQASTDILLTSQVPSLLYATELYQDQLAQGNTPLVYVTGSTDEDAVDDELEAIGLTLRDRISNFLSTNGVLPEQIRVANTGMYVRATVLEVEDLLGADELAGVEPSVMVVAPAYMMQRVGQSFYREDIQVVARPTQFYEFIVPDPEGFLERLATLIPNADALAVTTRATNEYLAIIYYFLRDWISGTFVWQGPIDVPPEQFQEFQQEELEDLGEENDNDLWPF